MANLQVSFQVKKPLGARLLMAVETGDGAGYNLEYRYERRGSEWWAVLEQMTERMPPSPPQIQGFDESVRFPMMEDGYFSAYREAEQRRKEWAVVNG